MCLSLQFTDIICLATCLSHRLCLCESDVSLRFTDMCLATCAQVQAVCAEAMIHEPFQLYS